MGKVTLNIEDSLHEALKESGLKMAPMIRRGIELALAEYRGVEPVPKLAPWVVYRQSLPAAPTAPPAPVVEVPVAEPAPEPVLEPVAAPEVQVPEPGPEPEPEPAPAPAPAPEPEPVAQGPEPEPEPEPVAQVPEPEPEPEPTKKVKLPTLTAPDGAVQRLDGVKWVDALWACETVGIEFEDLQIMLDEEDILNHDGVPHIDSLGIGTLVSLAHDKGISAQQVRLFERWHETL